MLRSSLVSGELCSTVRLSHLERARATLHIRNLNRQRRSSQNCRSYGTATEEADDTRKAELRRKRATEWKRRQDGQRFVDEITIRISGGTGGNGMISFHREKFKPFGPPSGGNGGGGGDVLIMPSKRVTSLAHIPRVVTAPNGENGASVWRHGRRGKDVVLEVPIGTVVRGTWAPPAISEREVGGEDDKVVTKEDGWRGRWIHKSGSQDANETRDAWRDANIALDREDEERRRVERARRKEEVFVDFSSFSELGTGVPSSDPSTESGVSSSSLRPAALKPYLLTPGGIGGLGNPSFLTKHNRSPKFASRGLTGSQMTLHLQLKLLADIGLVGFPNAGKSTLVRALTGMGTEIGEWAFTTLNPRVGVVRVWEDGKFTFGVESGVIEETKIEKTRLDELARTGVDTSDSHLHRARREEQKLLEEGFRFTIADNPGLIAEASANVGLGHSFLKSIERSAALVYVVDLSTPATAVTDPHNPPAEQALLTLREELEKYKQGLSGKARLVVANKADLLGPPAATRSEEEESQKVEEARARLAELEHFVKQEFHGLEVIPISGKFGMNLEGVVKRMKMYVEEARQRDDRTPAREVVVESKEEGGLLPGVLDSTPLLGTDTA